MSDKEIPEIEINNIEESYDHGHKSQRIRVRAETIEKVYEFIEKLTKNDTNKKKGI